jgi:hypothetical protein
MADVSFSQATQNLAGSLDKIQETLSDKIDKLATQINTLSAAGSGADVAGMDGVKDGDIVKMQYAINQMTKAAEAGASTYTKAENISKQVVRTLQG